MSVQIRLFSNAFGSHISCGFLKKLDPLLGSQAIRHASKKSGGNTRNKKHSARGKNRGPRVSEGQRVFRGQLLVKQLGMRVWPGENVYCDPVRHGLTAMMDGKVMWTEEKLSPYPESPLYGPINENGIVIIKPFVHVIPEPEIGRFKLVALDA